MNLFGLIISFIFLISGHKPEKFGPYIYYRCKKLDGFGFEAGMFFVIGKTSDSCKQHEGGHGLQNIIFGPLTPFIISIPSVIRYWYRDFKYYRKHIAPKNSYDDIWFEGQATSWGKKYLNF